MEIVEKQNEIVDNTIKTTEESIQKCKKRLVNQKTSLFDTNAFNEVVKIVDLESMENLKKDAESTKEKSASKIESSLANLDKWSASLIGGEPNQDDDNISETCKLNQDETDDVNDVSMTIAALKEASKLLDEDLKRLAKQLKDAQKFYDDRVRYHETLKLNQVCKVPTMMPTLNERQQQAQLGQAGNDKANKIGATDFVPASALVNKSRPSNDKRH